MVVRKQIAVVLVVGTMFAATLLAGPTSSPNPRDEFSTKINQYLEFRKLQIGAPMKPASSPEKLDSKREDSAEKMRSARASAKQGDVFSVPVTAFFKKQIVASLSGPDGKLIRSSLRNAEPVKKIQLAVNATYPHTLPLQTMPPSLLKKLPQLPQQLEYRLVGCALVLRDTGTNLIVDFIPDALPLLQETR